MKASIHTLLRRGEGGGVVHRGVALRQKAASWSKSVLSIGFPVFVGLVWLVGQASAQSDTNVCPEYGDPSVAVQRVVELLTRIQEIGVAIGIAAAALGYLYCGFLLMKGGPADVKRAKKVAAHVTLGLGIILLSGGLVEVVKQPLCGVTR